FDDSRWIEHGHRFVERMRSEPSGGGEVRGIHLFRSRRHAASEYRSRASLQRFASVAWIVLAYFSPSRSSCVATHTREPLGMRFAISGVQLPFSTAKIAGAFSAASPHRVAHARKSGPPSPTNTSHGSAWWPRRIARANASAMIAPPAL